MPENSLAKRIDTFELELTCVISLIDMLYNTPANHEYRSTFPEQLHTHRLRVRETYDNIRNELITGVFG